METIVGRMAARLTGDSSDFNRAADKAGDSVQAFDRKIEASNAALGRHSSALDKAGKSFVGLGKAVATVAFTALIADAAAAAGAIGLATAESIKFESSFAGVMKTVDASPAEFDALSASIRQMAKELPVNVNELNKIGEAAGQLGIHKENITDFIRTMADIGVSTNLSADQAADSLARLANITQMPQDQFRNLGSTVVALGNHLAATESEIVNMAERLAGAGHTIGLTEAQILAFAGALSSVGIDAEMGGTAFSRVMVEMADAVSGSSKKSRQALQDMAQVMGISADELSKKFKTDAAGAILQFVESLGKLHDQGADVFGVLEGLGFEDVRVRDTLLRAAGAGDLFRESLQIGSDAWRENTALTEEANKRYETTESKLEIAKNRLIDLAITAGGPFKDAFADVVKAFGDTIAGGEDVKRVVEEFTPVIHDAAQALIPLVQGFAKDAPGAIETFGAAILTLKGYLDVIGRVLDVVGTKLGQFLEPAGRLKDTVGELLFGDFERDVERKKAELRGQPMPETAHETSDRQERLLRATGMTEHQIRDLAAQGQGPGIPSHGRPDSSDYITSGGMLVLKEQADARLKAAQEAQAEWEKAKDIETQVSGEMAQPPGQADAFHGTAPKTKEERAAEAAAAKKAEQDAETARKKAEREAEAAREKAQRAAERAAQQQAELVAAFNRTIEDGAYATEVGLEKLAIKVNKSLGDVFEAGASGNEGATLARNIGDLIKAAEDAGVPQAKELGQALIAAASEAVVSHSPEAKAAAQTIIEQLNAGIMEASKLTADTFGKAWDKEALAFQLGSTGAAIMEALDAAITKGGPKAIDALAKQVASMRRLLIEDLSPELAAEQGATMMELLAQAIETKSPEAIQALEDFLRQLNQLLPLEKAGEAMAERINKAIDNAAERIKEIQESAAKRIEEAATNLAESRTLRGARQNVTDAQTAALKEATDSIEKERQAYRDMRDEQHILDARKLEDSEKAHARTLEDAKLQKDFDESMRLNKLHDVSSTAGRGPGGKTRLEEAAAQGIVTGPQADPALEARKAFEKKKKELADARTLEDAETERKRGIEDDNRKKMLAERDEDLRLDKERQTNLDNFRKDQAKDVQKYEDEVADGALEREKTRTLNASQDQIDKANAALATIEADEQQKFDTLQSKLEALAGVTIGQVQTAGDGALDGMLEDSGRILRNMLDAEAAQNRMSGGNGASGGDSGDSGDSGGSGGPVSVGGGFAQGAPDVTDVPEMASGGLFRRPTLVRVAEKYAPEAIAPLSSLQAMVNHAAYAGMAQASMNGGASTVAGPHIELHHPSFYGTGGPKAFTRQVNRDLTNDARDKQAVQGD